MKLQQLAAILCILLPIAALLSTGCGIVLFPVEVPKIVLTNAQTIRFHVDIQDEYGKPLDNVTVNITPCALEFNPLYGDTEGSKNDVTRIVDGGFDYKTFGSSSVTVIFRKPGYVEDVRRYANSDGPIGSMPIIGRTNINVKKHPNSTVLLMPAPPAATAPADLPLHTLSANTQPNS